MATYARARGRGKWSGIFSWADGRRDLTGRFVCRLPIGQGEAFSERSCDSTEREPERTEVGSGWNGEARHVWLGHGWRTVD